MRDSLSKRCVTASCVLLVMAWLGPIPAWGQPPAASPVPRTLDGRPDFQGVWSFSTLTPLERPDELAGKPFLTEVEAAQYIQQRIRNANADRRDGRGTERRPGEDTDVARAYNDFWYDRGTTVVDTRRSSLIIDPPDGRLPPLTPEGQRRASALAAYQRQGVRGPLDGPKTRPLRERCIWWDSEGPPLAPMGAYNAYLQLVQTPDHVVILMEMIHDARIIPLDGRPHLAPSIRQLLGDARGRWEGDTLIVETTNFRSMADFIDPDSFTDETDYRGSRLHARLTERLTRIDADTLRYEYTMEDATTWRQPWTGQQFLSRVDTPIYEYACHEGNQGMAGVLSGARAEEGVGHEPLLSQSTENGASDVIALERQIEQAVLSADTAFLDRVCSDDFTYTHGDGWTTGGAHRGVETKSAWLASLPGRYSLRDIETHDVELHGNVAITTGQVRARTGPSGTAPRAFSFWYVRVYEHRDGQWRYLSHRTVSGPVYER